MLRRTAHDHSRVLEDAPLPEGQLLAELTVDGLGLTAVSYHAPRG